MSYKETVLYHHLKTYILPLNEIQTSLILFRLPFNNVEYIIYFDGVILDVNKRHWKRKIEL